MSLLDPARDSGGSSPRVSTAHPDVSAAYRRCEQITRQQAKNFSYGIALLPGPKRRALSAVYAFARRIDDIGDGTMPAQDKIIELAQARTQVNALSQAGPVADSPVVDSPVIAGDEVLIALRDAAARFPIPIAAFGELIDGCEADVRGVSYATFEDLKHYCRCVAGSIGRLSLGVFGSNDMAQAASLADSLGIALQLTNIIRDIREDLGNGRVYLPSEDLRQFGCTLTPAGDDGQAVMAGPLADVVRFEAERAKEWYSVGMRLLAMLDWRSAACTGAMAGIYRRLLGHMSASPAAALDHRMSLPTTEKALVALGALTGSFRNRGGGSP
jgi:phytoene synthase